MRTALDTMMAIAEACTNPEAKDHIKRAFELDPDCFMIEGGDQGGQGGDGNGDDDGNGGQGGQQGNQRRQGGGQGGRGSQGGRQGGQGSGRRGARSSENAQTRITSDGQTAFIGYEGAGPDERAPLGYTERGLIRQRRPNRAA